MAPHRKGLSSEKTDPSDRIVCRCLQVTAAEIHDAVAVCELETIADICESTGAGDGCTACHVELRKLLIAAKRRAKNRVSVG